ncbi:MULTISPECIES: hypothetical protein [Listeria]|uniref:hypothetical protein n=1 Tax=Listeria TaxID=1637 RepID=UPI000B595B3A|nr:MULTISPECIES: hypothetical protein [Listeria]
MKNKQTEANKRWQNKNREHARYLRDRSITRSFIKNKATADDLFDLLGLIKSKQK